MAEPALEGLADIALPAPVSWMPQTWGWAALAVVIAILGAWLYVRARRAQEARRYRVEALAELDVLESKVESDMLRAEGLAALPPLIKRVALVAWPREAVASLSGPAWIDFLHARSGGPALPDALERLLDDGEYRPTLATIGADEARASIRAARTWIEDHHVRA